ncbi:Zinc finger MYM-type protein 5 [Eumeta japonica]|uniref:Zinc finger MYM-type protein 5 n=1 Tax=Eumeta variegata TaxID=151549 RepID=A0A4C1UX97_EUMVA|nr:Zinc finger MYM-type protein 5 [Eumeta japonica]
MGKNLIRKRKQEEERDKNTSKINKYFTALPSTSKESLETETSHVIAEGVVESDSKNASYSDHAAKVTSVPLPDTSDTPLSPPRQLPSLIPTFSKDDPGLWPEVLNATLIQYLTENPIKQYNFPRDSSGRKFSKYYYERHLGNGLAHRRCGDSARPCPQAVKASSKRSEGTEAQKLCEGSACRRCSKPKCITGTNARSLTSAARCALRGIPHIHTRTEADSLERGSKEYRTHSNTLY